MTNKNRFKIRVEKGDGTWIVDVCDSNMKRCRNSSPSFFRTKYEALKYAKEYSEISKIKLHE